MTQLTDGLPLLRALGDQGARPFAWPDLAVPVIDRGVHAIYPLAVAPVSDAEHPLDSLTLQEQATSLERACIHFYGGDGFHAETRLDATKGFGKNLASTGLLLTTPRYWWGIGRFAVVIVHALEPRRELKTLALHIIPKDWAWSSPLVPETRREKSRQRRLAKEQETVAGAANVSWSWGEA